MYSSYACHKKSYQCIQLQYQDSDYSYDYQNHHEDIAPMKFHYPNIVHCLTKFDQFLNQLLVPNAMQL